MNQKLEAARRDYNTYFADVVDKLLGLSEEELEKLKFEEISARIPDRTARTEYRNRAIRLLEQNLRDHFLNRPDALELWKSRKIRELKEWQSVAIE